MAEESPDTTLTAGYNFFTRNHRYRSSLAIQADAQQGNSDREALPSNTRLQYFVRYDGSAGWQELRAFELALQNIGSASIPRALSSAILDLGPSPEISTFTDAFMGDRKLNELEIEAYYIDTNGVFKLRDEYHFRNVAINSIDRNASDSGYRFSLEYDYLTRGHIEYEKSGTLQSAALVGWDQRTQTTDINSDYTGQSWLRADALEAGLTPSSLSTDEPRSIFLRIEDHSSELSSKVTTQWLPVEGFRFSMYNGTGLTELRNLELEFGTNRAITELTGALTKGRILQGLEIEVYNPDGDLLEQFHLENVLVQTINTDVDPQITSNRISFDVGQFTHNFLNTSGTSNTQILSIGNVGNATITENLIYTTGVPHSSVEQLRLSAGA